jgi:hypothetical protein
MHAFAHLHKDTTSHGSNKNSLMRLIYAVLFLACMPYHSYGWSLNPFAKKNKEESKSLRGSPGEESDEDFDEIEKDIVEAEVDELDASVLLDEVEEADDSEAREKALVLAKKEATDVVDDTADEESTTKTVQKGKALGLAKKEATVDGVDGVDDVATNEEEKTPNGVAKGYGDASSQSKEDEELDAQLAALTAELKSTKAEIEKVKWAKKETTEGSLDNVAADEEEKTPNGIAKGYGDAPSQSKEDEELDAQLAAVTAELKATKSEIEKVKRAKNGLGGGGTNKVTGSYAVSASSGGPAGG